MRSDNKQKKQIRELVKKAAKREISISQAVTSLVQLMEKYADRRLSAYLELDGSK